MRARLVAGLTLGFCAAAGVAAVLLEWKWLQIVSHTDLGANLFWFLTIDFTPLLVYSLIGVFGRKETGLSLVTCVCSVSAAGLWLYALADPVTDPRDPVLEVGLRGLCVGGLQCVIALPLALTALAFYFVGRPTPG